MTQTLNAQTAAPEKPADTQDQNATNGEIKEWQTKAQISKAMREIAENETAALVARLPSTDTEGAAGTAEIKGNGGYYAEILAYRALRQAANEIAEKITTPDAKDKEIIVTGTDVARVAPLWFLLEEKMEDFDRTFDCLLDKESIEDRADESRPVKIMAISTLLGAAAVPGAIIGAAGAITGAVADLAAFFRSDLVIQGRDITLSENALLAELASVLKGGWKSVYLPSLSFEKGYLVGKLDALLSKKAKVVKHRDTIEKQFRPLLGELAQKRQQLSEAEARLQTLREAKPPAANKIQEVETEIATLKNEISQLVEIEDRWKKYPDVLTAFDAFFKAITEGDKPTPLEKVRRFDVIKTHPEADLLLVDLVSQGGEIHTSKSIWRSAALTYLGGTVCTYFHQGPEGTYHGSGSVPIIEVGAFKPKTLLKSTPGPLDGSP